MTQETDRNGRMITFTYDRLSHLLQENYSGGSISFAYSVNGLITSSTDSGTGTMESFTYDNLNRVLTENTIFSGVSDTLSQGWSYDKASNVTGYTYSKSGTLVFANNYTYNALNQLITLAQVSKLQWLEKIPLETSLYMISLGKYLRR